MNAIRPDGCTTDGELPSAEALLADCYDDFRKVARRILAGNAMARVIQPTELAHEAAIRLLRARIVSIEGRRHLLAVAARAMRQILIDEARRRGSAKRTPFALLSVWPGERQTDPVDVLALDEALGALALVSPERAEVVEMRFMLGMSVEETAQACGSSERTVKRQWQSARAWLLDFMLREGDGVPA